LPLPPNFERLLICAVRAATRARSVL
jgi:hypothetical protein